MGPSLVGTVLFTGLGMTAAAFFIMNWAQRHTTAVRAALIFSLEPAAAALFSNVFGGEPLGTWDLVGGGLIVLGVVAGELGGAIAARRDLPSEPMA
jgi:drug/metabolite transporter (DMT)-like permease